MFDKERFLTESGFSELPDWNKDGKYPLPIFTDAIARIVYYGKVNPRTGIYSGGHGYGILPGGDGKQKHTEFPPDWDIEVVRQAFYALLYCQPLHIENHIIIRKSFRGVLLHLEFSTRALSIEDNIHFYPKKGPKVRAWHRGRQIRVSQKRQK